MKTKLLLKSIESQKKRIP